MDKKNNKKEKFIDTMRREAKKVKKTPLEFFLDVLELIMAVGFGFFLILIGTWALPQMPEKVSLLFAFTILCSACYVMYHYLNHKGVL